MSMKFGAGSGAPETLEFDFTPWGGPSGVIPEPTDAVLEAYLKFYDDLIETDTEAQLQDEANAITAAAPEAKVLVDGDLPELPGAEIPKSTPEPVRRSLQEIILGDMDKARSVVDAVGELCQQSPSAEQIWALPTRVRNGFANWVSNILVWGGGPEGNQPSGTSGSPEGEQGDGGTTSPAAS